MDIVDHAKELEMRQRQQALDAQKARQITEIPDEVDGVRYCLGCGLVVPKERLAAIPNAVRCVECQRIKEQ